jgi:isocitrate dehydrogenase (NAD+)
MLLSGVLMLRHLGLEEHASRIGGAVYKVLEEGRVFTPDIRGGHSTTTDFTLEVISNL